METKEYFELQEEFYAIAKENLQPDSEEVFAKEIKELLKWKKNY